MLIYLFKLLGSNLDTQTLQFYKENAVEVARQYYSAEVEGTGCYFLTVRVHSKNKIEK